MTDVTGIAAGAILRIAGGGGYRERVRRTVDFALDTEQMIRHRMATRGISFEQAVNDSIRQGFDRGVLDGTARAQRLGAPNGGAGNGSSGHSTSTDR